jgi:hypothetical protein
MLQLLLWMEGQELVALQPMAVINKHCWKVGWPPVFFCAWSQGNEEDSEGDDYGEEEVRGHMEGSRAFTASTAVSSAGFCTVTADVTMLAGFWLYSAWMSRKLTGRFRKAFRVAQMLRAPGLPALAGC